MSRSVGLSVPEECTTYNSYFASNLSLFRHMKNAAMISVIRMARKRGKRALTKAIVDFFMTSLSVV